MTPRDAQAGTRLLCCSITRDARDVLNTAKYSVNVCKGSWLEVFCSLPGLLEACAARGLSSDVRRGGHGHGHGTVPPPPTPSRTTEG